MYKKSLFAGLLAVCVASSAWAHSYTAGELIIDHPFARATVPGQASGGAYFGIKNNGKTEDRLLSANSPVAETVEIHTMKLDGDIMRMRRVDAIDIQPGADITMTPGNGYHLMMQKLKQPLKEGEKIPMTLRFEKAGEIKVYLSVETIGASNEHGHDHH